ncbi:MAG TPA: hypothetical protein VF163_02620 [Micromonosporaceae bacterium]
MAIFTLRAHINSFSAWINGSVSPGAERIGGIGGQRRHWRRFAPMAKARAEVSDGQCDRQGDGQCDGRAIGRAMVNAMTGRAIRPQPP